MQRQSITDVPHFQGVPVQVSDTMDGASSFVGENARHTMGLSSVPYLLAKEGKYWGGGTIEIYAHDVVVKRYFGGRGERPNRRRHISDLSRRSRERLRFTALNYSGEWEAWIDLTLPGKDFATDWREVERHRKTWFDRLRRQHKGIDYLWVKEYQQRGATHFHMLSSEWIDKDWLAKSWWEVVGSGDIDHLKAGTKVERVKDRTRASHYIAKYLTKKQQKVEGVGGRWWGTSRELVKPVAIYYANFEDMEIASNLLREWILGKYGHEVEGVLARFAGGTVFGGADVGEQIASGMSLERL